MGTTIARALALIACCTVAAACGGKKETPVAEGSAGSGSATQPPAGPRPKIAVSIFPLYDVTRRIAGDHAEVLLVVPPGKSEHGYDPTPKEVARLDGAKLGIAVGLDMDGWVETIMKSAGTARIVRLGDHVETIPIDVEPITEEEAHEHDDDHDKGHDEGVDEGHADHDHGVSGAPDPHFWMDGTRMVRVIDTLLGELEKELAPSAHEALRANAAQVKASIENADHAILGRSKTWTKRTIVTFHGSMAYFAKRYALRIAAVIEPLAGKEPTPQYIAEVLRAIKRGKAAALFSEPQLDRGPAETIAGEAKIPLGELDPVGGVPGRDTYENLITWNADQLEKVLK